MEKALGNKNRKILFSMVHVVTLPSPTAAPSHWNNKSVWSTDHFEILRDGLEHPLSGS